MKLIADDPIIRCMERGGWPPWMPTAASDTEEGEDADGL